MLGGVITYISMSDVCIYVNFLIRELLLLLSFLGVYESGIVSSYYVVSCWKLLPFTIIIDCTVLFVLSAIDWWNKIRSCAGNFIMVWIFLEYFGEYFGSSFFNKSIGLLSVPLQSDFAKTTLLFVIDLYHAAVTIMAPLYCFVHPQFGTMSWNGVKSR